MEVIVTHLKITRNLDSTNLKLISQNLKDGNIIVIPTETVYGLAADAFNVEAIKKIFKIKNRPADNPLIVHVSSIEMMKQFVTTIPDIAIKLAKNFWPGPLTIILKKSDQVPSIITSGLDSVAIRMPNHNMTLKIIQYTNMGLAAPSANLSGKPSPTTVNHCIKDLNDSVDIIVDGGICNFGVESTVISLIDKVPIILRPGVITKEQIEKVICSEVILSRTIFQKLDLGNNAPISPGIKYKHYSPSADLILIKSNLSSFINYVNNITDPLAAALVFDNEDKHINKPCFTYGKKDSDLCQSKNLFKVLREIDETDFKKIYVRCPNPSGVGLAVYNRLIRAANFNIVNINGN